MVVACGLLWGASDYLQRVSVVELGQLSKICGIAGLWAALTCTAIGSSVSHGEE